MTSQRHADINLHRFSDPAMLAKALAETAAADLGSALAARGRATLAVSGGNTPKAFLQALSRQPLDWTRVAVTLVDERWVPESDARSNARMVRGHLLQGAAAAARFLPLYRPTEMPEAALPELEQALRDLPLPLDVAILGMGDDGHTASFFPGGDLLEQALDPKETAAVLPMRAPGAGEPRITLSLPVLLAARRLYLHIEGAGKRQVLEQALAAGSKTPALPIARVLAWRKGATDTYWTA